MPFVYNGQGSGGQKMFDAVEGKGLRKKPNRKNRSKREGGEVKGNHYLLPPLRERGKLGVD